MWSLRTGVGRALLVPCTLLACPVAATAAQDAPVCIAIGLPAVKGMEGNALEVGGAVRELLASFLNGPSLQVTALEARLASQELAEAKQKGCGSLLVATLTRKRGGGGLLGQVVGQAGSAAAWQIPGGSAAAAVARGVAVAGSQAVTTVAYNTRVKDEMRLEFRITSTDGHPVLKPSTEEAKASVDGEDLLTPLVQKAAESIVAAVTGK